MPRETVWVAKRSEIPIGRMVYVDVDGLPIALANVGGTIYAFSDSCRHEGGPLSAGALIDDTVTCPWHGIEFDILTGRSLSSPRLRVRRYPVVVEDGQVKVTV